MNKLLRTYKFSVVSKWYAEYYIKRKNIVSAYEMISLGNLIKPIRRKIKKNDYDGILPVVSKIVFKTGEIVFRDENKTGMDLLLVKKGDLLVSNINFHQGAIALNDINDFVCSTHYQTYSINEKMILPTFLLIVLRSKYFLDVVAGMKANGIKNESGYDFISSFAIPVPSLSEQKKLVEKYNKQMQQADECEKKAGEIGNNIDEKILNLFGCKVPKIRQNGDILHFQKLSELLNWSVDLNFNTISPQNIFKTTKFHKKSISEIAEINPQTEYPKNIEEITFLPMECISDLYGEVAEKRQGTVSQTKGYTKFQDDDMLWAKITPCMENGKSVVAKGLLNGYGYGSTEYYVIRVDKKQVIPEYVYCFLRMKLVRNIAQTYFSGSAGQQRVRKEFLENLAIPVIPIKSLNNKELTQEKMVSMVFTYKTQMRALDEKSLVLRQQAQQEFEEAVFSEA